MVSATNETFMQEFAHAVEAFNQGDMDAWMAMWADDAEWLGAGRSRFGGRHTGPAIRAWFEAMHEMGFQAEPVDVLVDESHVVFFLHVVGEINGQAVDQIHANAYRVVDGRLARGYFMPDDLEAWDRAMG